MDGEEPGLLGNLPRSRPGTRSEKRDGPPPARPREPVAPAPDSSGSGDLVGDALRTVARTAGGVTREILRRLPRP
jgi:hypothetical protein